RDTVTCTASLGSPAPAPPPSRTPSLHDALPLYGVLRPEAPPAPRPATDAPQTPPAPALAAPPEVPSPRPDPVASARARFDLCLRSEPPPSGLPPRQTHVCRPLRRKKIKSASAVR